MAIILVGTKLMVGLLPLTDFVVMGTFVGGFAASTVPLGFAAHLLTGIIDGAIFAVFVTRIARLSLTGWSEAIGISLVFGFAVYLVAFLPISMLRFAPIMMVVMGPSAGSMMPTVQEVAIIEHLVFGLTVGAAVLIASGAALKCPNCGAAFPTKARLIGHDKNTRAVKNGSIPRVLPIPKRAC